MASINGISLKNFKVHKVDFKAYPNAETDAISMGDIYKGSKPLFHFAEDINGGPMNYSFVDLKNSNKPLMDFNSFKPAYYRWLSAVNDRKYVEHANFIYDLIALTELEYNFKKNFKAMGDGITLFGSIGLNSYGVFKGYIEKGNKNLTEKKKQDLELKVQEELNRYGGNSVVNCFTRAFRKLEDFDVIIGDERAAKVLLEKEMQEKKVQQQLEETKKEKEKADRNKVFSHFKQIDIEGEPAVLIEDMRTGKRARVPLFAYKDVIQALADLDL